MSAKSPSRADLLKDGGFYPVPVPLGWKLSGSEGEDVVIPVVSGHPFHRILARGALLATEAHPGQPRELMTLRHYKLPEAPSEAVLRQYSELVLAPLVDLGVEPSVASSGICSCRLSERPCAKLIVERASATDNRTSIHYLLLDRAGHSWELVYLLRPNNLAAWTPLLEEIDGPISSNS